MSNYIIVNGELVSVDSELYHYGRKGMKWGQRIFGKIRSGLNGRKKKRTEQGDDENTKIAPKKKTLSEMDDNELAAAIRRSEMEQRYKQLNSQTVSKGESFTKKFMDNAVKPALINAGRKQIEDYLNANISKLTKGKVDPDSMEALKAVNDKLSVKASIARNKRVIESTNDWLNEQATKKQKEASEKKREEEIKKQVDDYNKSGRTQDTVTPTTYSKKGEEISDRYTQTGTSSNLPAVVDRSVNTLGNTPMNSKEFASKAYKGEKYAEEILDKDGNVLAKFDKNGKRKRW